MQDERPGRSTAPVGERQIDAKHPFWQWSAWWATSILNRYAVGPNGRTTYELIIGHQTKLLVVSFGQHVLWRLPRKRSGARKLDSEWMVGIFLGLAGTSSEAYIGTANGVENANDFWLAADSPCSVDDLVNFKTSIREYVEGNTDSDAIAFPPTDPSGAYTPVPTTPSSTATPRIAQDASRLETARVFARGATAHRLVDIGWRRSLAVSECAKQQPGASMSLTNGFNKKMLALPPMALHLLLALHQL